MNYILYYSISQVILLFHPHFCLNIYGNNQPFTDLQPLNYVAVVFRCCQSGVSSGSILGRESPAEDALLHHIVGLDKQVVHLTVQVHWDGNSSAFSWLIIAK